MIRNCIVAGHAASRATRPVTQPELLPGAWETTTPSGTVFSCTSAPNARGPVDDRAVLGAGGVDQPFHTFPQYQRRLSLARLPLVLFCHTRGAVSAHLVFDDLERDPIADVQVVEAPVDDITPIEVQQVSSMFTDVPVAPVLRKYCRALIPRL